MERSTDRRRRAGSRLVLAGLLAGCGPSTVMTSGTAAGTSSGGSTTIAETSVDASTSPEPETSTTTGSLDSSSGAPEPVVCEDPEPLLQTGVEGEIPTGWERCASGVIHRVMPVTCENPLPPGGGCSVSGGGGGCTNDADCTELPYGACRDTTSLGPCTCAYGCATDDDCDADEICVCGGNALGYPTGSTCAAASCIDDGDCGDGLCAVGSTFSCYESIHRAACLGATAVCRTDEDCEDGTCYPQDDWSWACEPQGPVCATPSP